MQNKKIIFLASDCESSRWIYNSLVSDFEFSAAVIEQPVSRKALFRRRVKKIGFLKVTGQVMFSVLIVPWLKKKAKHRKASLIKQFRLNDADFDITKTSRVASVNDDVVKKILQQLQPDIVLVNGTRIITKNILRCTNAIFINMHVGITPWYRGSHGGYWALRNNDLANFGTTIHIIDTGVDTGAVLKQVFTHPEKPDNFTTYPILQTAIGITALKEVLDDIVAGNYNPLNHTEKGEMYYQPTIWQYFFG